MHMDQDNLGVNLKRENENLVLKYVAWLVISLLLSICFFTVVCSLYCCQQCLGKRSVILET